MSSHDPLVEGMYFTMYPNHILEALNCTNMTKTQLKICNHIIRNTFGWHRKWIVLTHEDLAAACATSRQSISTQIQQLIDKNIVISFGKKIFTASSYRINLEIETWDPSIFDHKHLSLQDTNFYPRNHPDHTPDSETQSTKVLYYTTTGGIVYSTPPSVNPALHTRVNPALHEDIPPSLERPDPQPSLNKPLNIIKNNIKYRENTVNNNEENIEYQLAIMYSQCILEKSPIGGETNLEKWSDTIKKMIHVDYIDPDRIAKVILFTSKNRDLYKHILKPERFRNSFDYMEALRIEEEENWKPLMKSIHQW